MASDDLGAPYRARSRDRYEDLCVALRDRVGIGIHLRDFFGRDCVNPLCLGEIGEHQCLLVIDCAYLFGGEARVDSAPVVVPDPVGSFEDRARRIGGGALRMSVAPDGIKFHVFEYIGGPGRD